MRRHPRHSALVATLPREVRAAVERALTSEDRAVAEAAAHVALGAVGLERGPGLSLVEQLTPAQRTVAELLAFAEVDVVTHRVAVTAEARRRQLGLAPPGPLERAVTLQKARVPLWFALDQLRDDAALLQKLVRGLRLTILERLELITEIARNPYGLSYTIAAYFPWGKPSELARPEVARWARRTADRVVSALGRSGGGWWYGTNVSKDFRAVLFEALVANRVPLDAAWDALLPVHFELAATKRVLRAIPEARRGAAAVTMLGWHMSSGKVLGGLELLAHFPSRELTMLVLEHAGNVDHVPKRDTMKKLEALAKKSAVIRAALGPAAGAAPRPELQLSITRTVRPKRVADLTPLQAEQLVASGKLYDGKRWSAAVRLGAEIPKGRNPERFEGSFAGFVEVREVADATKKPAFTVFLYLVDAGTVFRAGSAEPIASITQSRLEVLLPGDTSALHEALQTVVQPAAPRRAVTRGTSRSRADRPGGARR